MGRIRIINKEVGEEIRTRVEKGEVGVEIARDLDISPRTLYRYCSRNDILLKKGRRANRVYADTSVIKKWILSHPGEILDVNVEDLAKRFKVEKQYIWNYLYKTELRLEKKIKQDVKFYTSLLERPGAGIVYKNSIIPIISMKGYKFVRKQYTRVFRMKIFIGDAILLTDYFDEKTYGSVLR